MTHIYDISFTIYKNNKKHFKQDILRTNIPIYRYILAVCMKYSMRGGVEKPHTAQGRPSAV